MSQLRDVQNTSKVAHLCAPSLYKASFAGSVVDRQTAGGAPTNTLLVVFTAGCVADGVYSPYPEHSDDNSTWAAASPVMSAAFTAASSAAATVSSQSAAYLGDKRYYRCGISVTGTPSTGGYVGTVAIVGSGRKVPFS